MSYREMVRTCGLDFSPNGIPQADQLMERLKDYKYTLDHDENLRGGVLFLCDIQKGNTMMQSGEYPDPRSALLEAVMMVEQGKRWNGKEWVRM